ncbi:hypothetical protein J1605_009783 [Eschrichtius robustus]|uniref:Uncharacterized protein n=1 Tax=Eschrichtius robustus TaxID=9764 RepID=A0AB34GX13_ESCRO|nr:hypothetical protein J1605_009783 [Eschrichtius robustus]
MAEKSQGDQEKSRRDILRSTKRTWAPLDEQLPPGSEEESHSLTTPMLGENGPSGLFESNLLVSVNENLQPVISHIGKTREPRSSYALWT